jgi:Tol biopolymer transport system component
MRKGIAQHIRSSAIGDVALSCKTTRCVALTTAAIVLLLSALATDARAAFPGFNGNIAFTSDRDPDNPNGGDENIFLFDALEGPHANLTASSEVPDILPAFSPNGTKIAFTRVDALGNPYVFVMGADGSSPTNLTAGTGGSFSPDGTKIVFTRGGSFTDIDIWVMNADGSDQTNLTDDVEAQDFEPVFSPDGTKIAFASDRDRGYGGGLDIFVMGADGSAPTNLTSGTAGGGENPNFSPDGTKIAFDTNHDIWVMGSDGSSPTDIGGIDLDFDPAFSPDGTKIAFTGRIADFGEVGHIWVMNADGSSLMTLTGTGFNSFDSQPDWQPSATPPPDSDGDGVEDLFDYCRFQAGDPSNGGCPVNSPPSAGVDNGPDTQITLRPKQKTTVKAATFEFSSNRPGSTFECSLDGGAFTACTSPDTIKVKKGKHTFSVRARDPAGTVDATPATFNWKVKKKKKK